MASKYKSKFAGFSLGKRKEELEAIARDQSMKKRAFREEDYFEYDSDEEIEATEPTSPSVETAKQLIAKYRNVANQESSVGEGEEESDTEDDPLDAFMAGIETEVKRQATTEPSVKPTKAIRDDIEDEDDQESYFKAVASGPIIIYNEEDDIEIDYDSDGNPIIPDSAKVIDPLPPVDHSAIDYKSFQKDFYDEDESVKQLSEKELKDLRKKLGIRVSGYTPPRPCVSFAHFGFDEQLMSLIRKADFTTPTPIQSQAIPAGLSGRDVIGIAKTGSGKTVAYLWPLLIHCIDQPELKEGDGPIALICAPTRELCQQIYHQAKKYGKAYNLSVCCIYGGGNKWEQSQAVKEGCEVLVATPGRLIDLVRSNATNLLRVTFLVFDEADRMFDLGFEPQVRSIANHVRPDRQTLLFSATFRKKVERLCRDILTDPVRIVIGDVGEANTDITQLVTVFHDPKDKWAWLLGRLVEFISAGSVLIFATRKVTSEEVTTGLRQSGYQAGLLHGDMSQGERDEVITNFKKKAFPVLVATDVAARGLDIPAIKTVINYDVAKNIDTHVHRIGRTGRAGEKGSAHTLVTHKDVNFAGDLVRNLEAADQIVPDELLQLAMQNPRFKKSRSRNKKGGSGIGGGGILGGGGGGGRGRRKVRLGLGATSQTPSTSLPTIPVIPGGGPSANRAAALKEAMQAHYKMKFQAASSTQFSTTSSLSSGNETSSTTRKRKSRWD